MKIQTSTRSEAALGLRKWCQTKKSPCLDPARSTPSMDSHGLGGISMDSHGLGLLQEGIYRIPFCLDPFLSRQKVFHIHFVLVSMQPRAHRILPKQNMSNDFHLIPQERVQNWNDICQNSRTQLI